VAVPVSCNNVENIAGSVSKGINSKAPADLYGCLIAEIDQSNKHRDQELE
jgi:hypothetical protein